MQTLPLGHADRRKHDLHDYSAMNHNQEAEISQRSPLLSIRMSNCEAGWLATRNTE